MIAALVRGFTRTSPAGAPPTRDQLLEYACRNGAALAVVAIAASLSYRGGYADQVGPYAVIAAALVPQVLMATVALAKEDRRVALRTSPQPDLIPGLLAAVLAISALVTWLLGQPSAASVAAGVAAAGLSVAALPASVRFAPRP